jgi:hypothetical protein
MTGRMPQNKWWLNSIDVGKALLMTAQWTSRKWNDKQEELTIGHYRWELNKMEWLHKCYERTVMFYRTPIGLSWRIVVGDSYEVFQVEGDWQTLIFNALYTGKTRRCLCCLLYAPHLMTEGWSVFWPRSLMTAHWALRTSVEWQIDSSLQPSPHRSKLALSGNWFLRSSSMDDASSAKGSFWFSDLIGPILMPINGKLSEWRAVTSIAKFSTAFKKGTPIALSCRIVEGVSYEILW